MKEFFFVLLILISNLSFSQTQEEILKEAESRNISTRQQVLNELAQNGISEQAAREMASMRGINFDTFLNEYFSNNKSEILQDNNLDQTDSTVDKISVKNEVKIDSSKNQTNENDFVASDETFFGYSIFENNPFKNKEYLVGNIDEGYILAPGDELKIMVFGNNSLEAILKIDLNGNISIPNLGVFQAAGNTFKTLKSRLKLFLGKFYSGLLSYPQQTFLDISLTQIRPVNVTVLGEINSPGSHLVNGLASTLNALYAAGGIKTSGTLREIKIFRDKKIISYVDLYDYITGNNLNSDIRLSNNDVIFVGPRLSSVKLEGEVKNQSVYEIKENETLEDLIYFSGGLPNTASIENVNISRIKLINDRNDENRFDKFLNTIDFSKMEFSDYKLQDGDLVEIKKILDEQLNEVSIFGNVYNEGKFSLLKFSNLRDLILNGSMGVKQNTYFKKVDINRTDNEGNKFFKTFSLSDVINEDVYVELKDKDEIRVYSLSDVEGENEISISGFVKNEKTTFWREGLSLYDLIFESTSFEELDFQRRVLTSRVDLKRYDKASLSYKTLVYSLENLNELTKVFLLKNDKLILYTREVFEDVDKKIFVLGAVKNPSQFELNKDMFVEDAILAAQGFNPNAEKKNVVIYSFNRNLNNGNYSDVINYEIDTDYLIGKKPKPTKPFLLKNNDVVSVSSILRYNNLQSVDIQGEINNPSTIILNRDFISFDDALERVGGLSVLADIRSSYILRNNKVLFFDLTKNNNLKKLNLISGDKIIIASKLSPIITAGNFLNPSTFSDQNKRAKYYIRLSGKKMNKTESVVVKRNNGSSSKVNFFKNPKVYPGDVITATSKPSKNDEESTRKFLDDFIRVFSIITGTLTTILITSKL
tara:strand:+ start:7804 stop:10428 length:2625 start_codon:yes stop_codon:yes gene_type:complete